VLAVLVYRADYSDEDVMHVFEADTDGDAYQWARDQEPDLTLFNVFELDENY